VTMEAERIDQPTKDPVSNVLKWVLLVVAVASFAILGWTTKLTYEAAPPFPDRFVTSDGAVLMSAADIVSGKAGFQKADLMGYGSLYGMGSYFGEDYTAAYLVRLAEGKRELEEQQRDLPPGISTVEMPRPI
jgi:nitric oxide reductase subunit B